jgi:hypothetical protein
MTTDVSEGRTAFIFRNEDTLSKQQAVSPCLTYLDPEDEGDMFLPNVLELLPDDTASHVRISYCLLIYTRVICHYDRPCVYLQRVSFYTLLQPTRLFLCPDGLSRYINVIYCAPSLYVRLREVIFRDILMK